MKIKKYQKPSGPLPKKSFWWNLANQLQSAPSNGETTIAAHNADLNRQVEQARKEGKSEDEVYKRGLLGTLGGIAAGQTGVTSMAASAGTFGPLIADITNGIFATDATRNLISDQGIKKTYNLYKSGKTGKAIGNTALNLLDLSFIGHTGALLGRVGKTAYNTRKGLKNAYTSDLISRELSKNVQELKNIPGKVKYYGPTMGKTTAAKSNSGLVDFDDIIRKPSKDILNKYGFGSKYEMFESGNKEAIKEYQDMLVSEMKKFKADPKNSGKTLIVSPAPVASPEKTGFRFDNAPSIPSKEEFIRRNVQRGGTEKESENWWSNLIKENPNLKIDDRYVSEIEQSIPNNHQLFRATVYRGGNIKDPQSIFFTTDPEYAKQYGVLNKYLLEQKGSAAIAKEPMIGSRDVVTQDMFIDRNAINGQNIIIGHDAITSDIPRRSNGIEILSIRKPNILRQLTNNQNTFDANWKIPSKVSSISKKELNGIIKQERNSPERIINRVVSRDGNVNKEELLKLYHKVIKENSPIIRANSSYVSGGETSSLKKHLTDVVKTAQTIPVPKGSSKAELVRSALIHDIGKLLTGQEDIHGSVLHPMVGKNIISTTLKGTEFDTPTIRAATRYHMYQNGKLGTFNRHGIVYENDPLTGQMKINYDLIRALQASDVARGLEYDKAAAKYPQLFTYAKENPVKIKFAEGDTKWELKNVVNPILKREGYPTLSLKDLENQINASRERHRSFLRGVRDPLKASGLNSISNRNADNASKNAIRFYGENNPTNRMLVSVERIAEAPTGSGRADLFNIAYDSNGFPQHTDDWLAKYLKVDPKSQDAIYLTTSKKISENFGNINNSRSTDNLIARLTIPFEKLKSDESLGKFMERTDFQLYDGNAIRSGNSPMSMWQKYELPYRLQTGKSFQKDFKDYFLSKHPEFNLLKRKTTTRVVDSLPNYINGYSTLNELNEIESLYKKLGIKFTPIKQTEDGKTLFNYDALTFLLNAFHKVDDTKLLTSKQIKLKNQLNKRISTLTDKVRRFENYKYEIEHPNPWGSLDIPRETVKLPSGEIEYYELTNEGVIQKLNNYRKELEKLKESRDKYIYNKNYWHKVKDTYYKMVKPKLVSSEEYSRFLKDENNYIEFMRKNSVSPIWDMPSFGKTSIISTNGGRWGDRPATRNKVIQNSNSPQGIIIGDLNEKVLQATNTSTKSINFKRVGNRDSGGRYLGEDVWPITRKTFKLGGSLNKKPNSE